MLVPTMFLVFKAIQPQHNPAMLTRSMPDTLGYLCKWTGPKRIVETSNAAFQPFHLLKVNKMSPLNDNGARPSHRSKEAARARDLNCSTMSWLIIYLYRCLFSLLRAKSPPSRLVQDP